MPPAGKSARSPAPRWRRATRPASSRRAGICGCNPRPRRRRRLAAADPEQHAPAGAAQAGGQGAGGAQAQEPSPFGAGCSTPGGQGGGFGGPAVTLNGPFVIGGVYQVSLLVDGKTVDTKPLRVNDDPEVVLTSLERKRMFDMAMEIHALQPRVADASAAHASLTWQTAEIATALGGRTDVPADVKSLFE